MAEKELKGSLKDYLHMHFIVLLWGFTAILGKLISIPALEMVFFRTLIASITIGLWLYVWQKRRFNIGMPAIATLGLTGIIIALHWIFFFGAVKVANVSICLVGMSTTSLWTAFLEPLFKKKKIQIYEVLLGIVIIFGLYVIFTFEASSNSDYFIGLLMALFSAFLGALFSTMNGNFALRYDHWEISFFELTGAFIACALFFPFYTEFLSPTGELNLLPTLEDWGWLLILAWVCTVYAFAASVELLKRITVFASNLIVNLEPVYGIVLAALIFKEYENLDDSFYYGTLIILMAVISYPIFERWRKRRKHNF
ncbi:MAG: DMT family transporter [Bernardetiaceae bacterium]|nr:DMT family transporter [Bernardetiaceae bacterium]